MDQDDFDLAPEVEEVSEDLDPDNPEDAFAILERNYNRVVCEMEENPEFQPYLEEYSKLFDYLYVTMEDAVRLSTENKTLKTKVNAQDELLATSKMSLKQDTLTIGELKIEVDKCHKLLDTAHSREQNAQEMIDNLRKQIASLNADIEFKNKMALGDLEENSSVVKHREGLEREKLKLLSKITKLQDKLSHALAYQEDLEKRTDQTDVKITQIKNQLEETTATMEKYKRAKETLEQTLEESQESLRQKRDEMDCLVLLMRDQNQITDQQEIDLKKRRYVAMKCQRELESCGKRNKKLQMVVDKLNLETAIAKKENDLAQQDLRIKEMECQKMAVEIAKLNKEGHQIEKKLQQLDHEKAKLVDEKNALLKTVESFHHEINTQQRQSTIGQREKDTLEWDKKMLAVHLEGQKIVNKNNLKVIHAQGQTQKNLEIELNIWKQEEEKKQKEVEYLIHERERISMEVKEKEKKINELNDELDLQKKVILRTQKEKEELETKLRKEHNINELLQAQKIDSQKALREAATEKRNLQDKIQIQHYQNEGLKDMITAKEQLLIKHDAILRKVVKHKDAIKIDLNNTNKQVVTMKTDIHECKATSEHLRVCLLKSEKVIKDQNRFLTSIINDRDILGCQLVRRNDELQLVYEKIKILQAILNRGEEQYEQRLADIKLLKLEVKRLRQEKSFLTSSIENMTDLKQEVFHLERDLTMERLKCKVLEDELHNPMNIHRWRKLEGSDPQVFELLQKIRLLQKRVLNQAGQMLDRERQLREAETMYMSLRKMLSKQPGPEIHSRLKKAQDALFTSSNKIKCLIAELNMAEMQNNECNTHLKTTHTELALVKKQLLTEKKKRAKNLEVLRTMSAQNASKPAPSHCHKPKHFGGGFRLMALSVSTTVPIKL